MGERGTERQGQRETETSSHPCDKEPGPLESVSCGPLPGPRITLTMEILKFLAQRCPESLLREACGQRRDSSLSVPAPQPTRKRPAPRGLRQKNQKKLQKLQEPSLGNSRQQPRARPAPLPSAPLRGSPKPPGVPPGTVRVPARRAPSRASKGLGRDPAGQGFAAGQEAAPPPAGPGPRSRAASQD